MRYDVESLVLKIYSEFSSSAKRKEELKDFFTFTQLNYSELLRHVPTRWLSLLPAIERLAHHWPALKSYFLSRGESKCHKIIWEFVAPRAHGIGDDNATTKHLPECYIYFLHNLLPVFNRAILKAESNTFTVTEIDGVMRELISQLENRKRDKFYGSEVKGILEALTREEKAIFETNIDLFFEKCIAYLKKNYDFEKHHY